MVSMGCDSIVNSRDGYAWSDDRIEYEPSISMTQIKIKRFMKVKKIGISSGVGDSESDGEGGLSKKKKMMDEMRAPVIKLTEEQEGVMNGLKNFLEREIPGVGGEEIKISDVAITLEGYAGTGKTTLTRFLLKYIKERLFVKTLGVAPTHKARHVLDNNLNIGMIKKTKTMTIASLLNKMRAHSYTGTKLFESKGTKIADYDIFILDEVSMVSDKDLGAIIGYAIQFRKKFILIGDPAQIPNPAQGYLLRRDETLIRRDSKAFRVVPKLTLTKVIRQKDENPLMEIYTCFRENILGKVDFKRESKVNELGEGVIFYDDHMNFVSEIRNVYGKFFERKVSRKITSYFTPPVSLCLGEGRDETDNKYVIKTREIMRHKIIAYTNMAVEAYNELVRKNWGIMEQYQAGEILMGYSDVGFPERIIENGQDYEILRSRHVDDHELILPDGYYGGLVGWQVWTQEIYPEDVSLDIKKVKGKRGIKKHMLFFPDIDNPANREVLDELVERAEKNNRIGSTKADFKYYDILKSKLIFREDIYKFAGKILTSRDLTTSHPMIFTRVLDVIDENPDYTKRVVKEPENRATADFLETYREIVEYRLKDKKIIGDSETFADRFQVIWKDIDYGYAITAHKSQGSTYDEVFINEMDFFKIKNRIHPKYNVLEIKEKERNQLLYVSYSRPKKKAYVFSTIKDFDLGA